MDDYKWTEAIDKLNELSPDFLAKRENQFTLASAYAGRCGLDFVNLANNFLENTSSRAFQIIFGVFPSSTTAEINDCKQAETIIRAVTDNPAQRTDNENILMAFVGFAKIGAVLNTYADLDQDKDVDIAPDPDPFDACDANDLANADAAEVSTGIALAKESLEAVTAPIAQDQLAAIQTVCTSLAAIPPAGTYDDICTEKDPANITGSAVLLSAIRKLIAENTTIGLGTCSGNVATCCP